MSRIHVKTYRGRGIYRYPTLGYGDETQCFASSVAECESRIDSAIAESERQRVAGMSPADRLWSSLTASERHEYRLAFSRLPMEEQERFYTPAEYALAVGS